MSKKITFQTEYWEKTASLIEFVLSSGVPSGLPITAVKLFDIKNEQLLMVKIPRGWDIPGGHVELGESPEKALYREIKEETNGELIGSKLIGYLHITNQDKNKYNINYPKKSCILIYIGSVINDGFNEKITHNYEATDCKRIPINNIENIVDNWSKLSQQMLNYIHSISNK